MGTDRALCSGGWMLGVEPENLGHILEQLFITLGGHS